MLSQSSHTVDEETSSTARWLGERRVRLSLWIAAAEAIIVAVSHDLTRWTVILLAIVAVAVYVFAGRESRSDTFRQASWIFAASQLLAVLAASFAFLFKWVAIGAVVLFVLVALFFVFTDRR